MDSYAPNWTDEEREQYKRDYLAEKPVLQATREHDDEECEHCKLLRQLQREADEQSDQEIGRRLLEGDRAVAKRVVDERQGRRGACGLASQARSRDEDLVVQRHRQLAAEGRRYHARREDGRDIRPADGASVSDAAPVRERLSVRSAKP
jgi:hypothetical protein